MIQTDERGERRFFHWRENSAARMLMDLPDTEDILKSLPTYDIVYLSAITLSIYTEHGRGAADRRRSSVRVCRARALPSIPIFARGAGPISMSRARVFSDAFEDADIVLASTEDLLPLYPGESNEQLMSAHSPARRRC